MHIRSMNLRFEKTLAVAFQKIVILPSFFLKNARLQWLLTVLLWYYCIFVVIKNINKLQICFSRDDP